MEIVRYLLIVVEVLCSILLIGAILLQRTKGQGMGGLSFGSAMGESLFGPQVGTVLTKATVILAIVFLVNTTALALMTGSRAQPKSVTANLPQKTEQPAPGTTPISATAPIPTTTPPPETPAPETPAPPVPPTETPPKTTP